MCSIYWVHKRNNNTQIDNAKDIDVIIPMYNLIEYSNNYSKTSASLWRYYRDEPALNDAGTLENVPGNSASCKFKQKITYSRAIMILKILK